MDTNSEFYLRGMADVFDRIVLLVSKNITNQIKEYHSVRDSKLTFSQNFGFWLLDCCLKLIWGE